MYFKESETLYAESSLSKLAVSSIDNYFSQRLKFTPVLTTPSKVARDTNLPLRDVHLVLFALSEKGAIDKKVALYCAKCESIVFIKPSYEDIPDRSICNICNCEITKSMSSALVVFEAKQKESAPPFTHGQSDSALALPDGLQSLCGTELASADARNDSLETHYHYNFNNCDLSHSSLAPAHNQTQHIIAGNSLLNSGKINSENTQSTLHNNIQANNESQVNVASEGSTVMAQFTKNESNPWGVIQWIGTAILTIIIALLTWHFNDFI